MIHSVIREKHARHHDVGTERPSAQRSVIAARVAQRHSPIAEPWVINPRRESGP